MNQNLDMLKSIKNPENFDFLRSSSYELNNNTNNKLLMHSSNPSNSGHIQQTMNIINPHHNRKRRFDNPDHSPTDASNSSFESSSHLTLSPSLNDSSGNSSTQNANTGQSLFLTSNQSFNYFDNAYFTQRYNNTNNGSTNGNNFTSLDRDSTSNYLHHQDQFNQTNNNNSYSNNFDSMIKAFSSTYGTNLGGVNHPSQHHQSSNELYEQNANRNSTSYSGYQNNGQNASWNFEDGTFMNDSYNSGGTSSFKNHLPDPYTNNNNNSNSTAGESFSNYSFPKLSVTNNQVVASNESGPIAYLDQITTSTTATTTSKMTNNQQSSNSSSGATNHQQAPGANNNDLGNLICDTSMVNEIDYNPRELEAFAERFKQRRIKLGVTQADVGKALGNLKLAGVGSLSQSTICRFESLTLSHNNMVALKPILQAWLEEAEMDANARLKAADMMYDSDDEKKRKRTSITDSEKRSLEAFFGIQPRPSSEKISQIADKLNLKKNVVRVWFCNQRQKQKRMKFSTLGILGHYSPVI